MMLLLAIAFAILKTSISLNFTSRIGDTSTGALNFTCRGDTLSVIMPQNKSCVINDARMQEIFTETIVLSYCNPKELFKLKTRPGGGALYSSVWANIKKKSHTLSLILDETNGQSLTHRPLGKQLDT
jgi:hypothetical protein